MFTSVDPNLFFFNIYIKYCIHIGIYIYTYIITCLTYNSVPVCSCLLSPVYLEADEAAYSPG